MGGRTSGTRPRGNGAGWGGPAKGYSAVAGPKFTKGNQAATVASDDERKARMTRREFRKARSEDLEDVLFDLAKEGEAEMSKIQAASKLHAIYNGQPMATNLNVNLDDLGDRDAATNAAEIARIEAEEAELKARIQAGPLASKPAGIRH